MNSSGSFWPLGHSARGQAGPRSFTNSGYDISNFLSAYSRAHVIGRWEPSSSLSSSRPRDLERQVEMLVRETVENGPSKRARLLTGKVYLLAERANRFQLRENSGEMKIQSMAKRNTRNGRRRQAEMVCQ